MEEPTEKIKKLAEALKLAGLASSEEDSIEKAKASLRAEEIIQKSHNKDNYFNKNIKVKDLIKPNEEEKEAEHVDEIIKQASPNPKQEIEVEKENIINIEDDKDEEEYDEEERDSDEE